MHTPVDTICVNSSAHLSVSLCIPHVCTAAIGTTVASAWRMDAALSLLKVVAGGFSGVGGVGPDLTGRVGPDLTDGVRPRLVWRLAGRGT